MNRFQIALELLDKIYPERTLSPRRSDLLLPPPDGNGTFHHQNENRITDYIESIKPLPHFSVLLGTCPDGLPLLIDLASAKLSACLIQVGAKGAGVRLLRMLLHSAVRLNPPEIIQYVIITPHLRDYQFESGFPHCLDILHPGQREAGELVMELSALVEQRHTGRQRGPALIFVIEELERFMHVMDGEIFSNFKWILSEGPGAKVWPIATTDGSAWLSDRKMMPLFETRIDSANYLPAGPAQAANRFAGNASDFQISFGGETFNFGLPAH